MYSIYIILDQLVDSNLIDMHNQNNIVKSITLDYPEHSKILRSVLSMKPAF
jgi:hypothetical protein